MKHIAVIDIGKTNAKVAIVDLSTLSETAIRKTPNSILNTGLYPHTDVETLWNFILESLKALNQSHLIDAIIVTTHGATAALLNKQGELALPVLDYEFSGPNELSESYNSVRPDFSETGSPRLPIGLNLGAQIFWQQQKFSDAFAKATQLLMYPQYWSYRLSGVAAAEVTSLGCHTDLWLPRSGCYSPLVDSCGLSLLMPPLRQASDVLGPLRPELVNLTGLRGDTLVYCGLHDSNASLVPHLIQRTVPCAVVSTGTWVIAMAVGGKLPVLDSSRDTLLNVNAFGDCVPSARFMGGREYQIIMEGVHAKPTHGDVLDVLKSGTMLLPSVASGCGPFPTQTFKWIDAEQLTPEKRQIEVSFYLALMTATCLDLIGAEGDIIVEGPFSTNQLLLDMLAAATGRPVFVGSTTATGTTIGAASLIAQKAADHPRKHPDHNSWHEQLAAYAEAWRIYTRDERPNLSSKA